MMDYEWYEDELIEVYSENEHSSIIHTIDGAFEAVGHFRDGQLVQVLDAVRVNLNAMTQEEVDADMGADEYKREMEV